ncbi:MAG: thymidine phosphorylase [Clostridia bacterium]|nr:thymidine phosphorylase [Clostridia bacterium]
MKTFDLIEKKKNGGELTEGELAFFVRGATSGEIPDYQLSAMLMAICLRGMTDGETAVLTREMANSGETMDLDSLGIGDGSCDKHSTGGVGDKTTLIVAPAAAACGVRVVKMSGRGLGATGGTADKLESIPGFSCSLTTGRFVSLVKENGVAVACQGDELAPADKRLYALRDVTATVDSVPLIASSVMCKKLASGAHSIVLDVKYGSGAFMKTADEAEALAHLMVKIGEAHGRRMSVTATDMNRPLGFAVGNILEVNEAVRVLRGEESGELFDLSVRLTAEMVRLALGKDGDSSEKAARKAILTGAAYEKFLTLVEAQGGNATPLRAGGYYPVHAAERYEFRAEKDGYFTSPDAGLTGKASVALGAGRAKKGDAVDPAAGILLHKKDGEQVRAREVTAEIFAPDKEKLRDGAELMKKAFAAVS